VEVELAVTPDIAIPLPRPGQGRTAESPISAPRRKPSTSTRRRTENRQLRDQLDSATGALQAALVARNEAVAAAAHERKRLAAERQRVDAEGARLVGERDLAVAERDRLAGERDRLAGERDAAVAELDRLVGERDRLKAELARVAADLDACVAALEEARNSREKLPTPEKFPTVEKLPTSGISHRALPARAPLKYQPAIIHARLQRAFATAMLLAALVALAVILRIL
jgi:hypothetical protein